MVWLYGQGYTVVCLKSGLQKIRTFAFLRKSSCPKNPDIFVFAKQALSKISGLSWFDRGYFQKNAHFGETFFVFFFINRPSAVEYGQSLYRFQLINRPHAFEPEDSTFWRAFALFLKIAIFQKIRTFAFWKNRTFPKNPDFWIFAKKDLSKKSGLSPKIPTHASPDFKQTTVIYIAWNPNWGRNGAVCEEPRQI